MKWCDLYIAKSMLFYLLFIGRALRTLCICYPAIGRPSIPFCIKPVPSSGHAGLILYIDYMCALHCDENLTCVNSIRVLILFCPRHVAKLLHSCTCILHFLTKGSLPPSPLSLSLFMKVIFRINLIIFKFLKQIT